MTTIAARDGVIAGDTQVSLGSRIEPKKHTKIKFIEGVGLVGFAGNLLDIIMIVEALEEYNTTNIALPCECDISGINIDPKGKIFSLWVGGDNKLRKVPETKYYAVGSDSHFALGALEVGATATMAVKVACKLDSNTGGVVQALSIKDFL